VIITKASIPDVLIIEPELFADERGFLTELYQSDRYASSGVARRFVQDNLSRSVRHTLRGLHFQNPMAQGKLVTVLRGAIRDVAVDIRRGSPTFGQHVMIELNEDNRRQIWIPPGFAHGFITLSEIAECFYKCDEFYSPAREHVLRWNDPALGIDWGCVKPLLSRRDQDGKDLAQLLDVLPPLNAACRN
jgi:dTDP-4-dehydrorhamnose 3,5-epimerase